MKKIILKRLKITHFKGIQSFEVNFNHEKNAIYGDNATGKSTLFDAWTWLLFGKDSADRTSFEIKPILPDGKYLHKVDTEVEADLLVGEHTITLKKVYKEKWVKKRGSEELHMEGHETTHFWNNVPISASQYSDKISELLEESSFKLISNTSYFNTQISWKQRREMLESMAGSISDADVIATADKAVKSQLQALLDRMASEQKTIEELAKEMAATKKKLVKELDAIPSRLDELSKMAVSLPENFSLQSKEKHLAELTEQITSIQAEIDKEREKSKDARNQIMALDKDATEYERKLRDTSRKEKQEYEDELYKWHQEFHNAIKEQKRLEDDIETLKQIVADNEKRMTDLRQEWIKLNEQSSSVEDTCDNCGQPLPKDQLDLYEKKAKESKQRKLDAINYQGKQIADETAKMKNTITGYQERIEEVKKDIGNINGKIKQLKEKEGGLDMIEQIIKEDTYLKNTEAEIKQLEKQLEGVSENADIKRLEQDREALLKEIQDYKSLESQQIGHKRRRDELLAQERQYASQISEVEQTEYHIEQYAKYKIEAVEKSVNDKFSLITFKLFEQQINGGQKPTCVTLIGGVPYSDANHAAQINAGIDIINAFQKHLDVCAPVFVDNAEAINQIIETPAQLIRLVVSKHETLTVE